MEQVTYELSEEKIFSKNGVRVSYGIVASVDTDSEDTATIIASVRDLSPIRQKVENLVHMCNQMNLSLIHFDDL